MEWINIIASVLGGIGISGIITQFFNGREKRKERNFNKKEHAYLGLLHALHHAALMPSDRSSKDYALWQAKVELVGSPDVIRFVQHIIDTNDDIEGRKTAIKNLNEAMRKDLGIDKRKKKHETI